nr:MAG: ORF1 [TTV-like mini virus]
MPYYYRRRRYQPRWRRRFWTWRSRKNFRRRRRWRKHRRVRKKLSKITVKEYQPETIRKCCIKGIQQLIIANKKRLTNNYRDYENSYIYENQPVGGGYSITKYNLDALYEQHQKVRNWWTNTNNNLPLVRYTGCKLKLYRSEEVDYVLSYYTCYPMIDTLHLNNSMQPSIQLMNPDSIIVPSKKTQPKGKPYKTVKIRPPAQMQSKWYFTQDIAKTGLLLVGASLCSLDHYYISPFAESNNTSFKTLNTKYFNKHNFASTTQYGYIPWQKGTEQKTIWVHKTANNNQTNLDNLKFADLIYLGNCSTYQPGNTIGEIISNSGTVNNYFSNYKNWGNLFWHSYLHGEALFVICTASWHEILTYTKETKLTSDKKFTPLTEPIYITCRYTPEIDTGHENQCYILPITRDDTEWNPPNNENLKHAGFPLWILFFGWLDWLRKAKVVVHIDEFYTVVFQSKFITPKLDFYCPIDEDMFNNRSPYQPQDNMIVPSDTSNWNPHVRFQQQTLENICKCGPGIAKFPDYIKSVEAKLKYQFYFKFGGCPPKMDTITDPTKQIKFPIPGNEQQIYSLQNPSAPPETFLYNFDVRQDLLTKAATKRIKRDWETETTLLSTTGKWTAPTSATQETPETSDEEKDPENEEETLLQKLHRYRLKRQRLQHKLLQLMKQE